MTKVPDLLNALRRILAPGLSFFVAAPGLRSGGLCAGAALLLMFAGCAKYAVFARNHDRDFTAGYDVTSGMASLSGRIARASVPGNGTRSIGWEITGRTPTVYPNILDEQPRLGGDGKGVIR